MNLDPIFPVTKLNSKGVKDLNIRPKTIKTAKRKWGKFFGILEWSKVFWRRHEKHRNEN
jgi:hypothetical protein